MKNKKRWSILKIILTFIITTALCIIFGVVIYYFRNKNIDIAYNSTYDIDYKVYLIKDNYFKKDYLEKDNQYISEIVDYIDVTLKYKFNIDNYSDLNLDYSYDVVANLQLADKENGSVLYSDDYNLISREKKYYNSLFDIEENIKINYREYNNIAEEIINRYSLQNVKSELKIIMKIKNNVDGSSLDKKKKLNDEISMTIPLNVKTFNISTDKRKIDTQTSKYISTINKNSNKNAKFVIIFLIILELFLISIYVLLRINMRKYDYQAIYNDEINSIKKKYGCFIQKVYNTFNLTGYQIIRVREFKNLLDIMEIINSPILMLENNAKDGCFFIVITNTKFIYVYGVKVSEIKKRLSKK